MSVRRLRLFLDANVLHSAAVRDFLLRLAEAEVVDVRWSGLVLEETRQSLEDRGLPADKVDRLIFLERVAKTAPRFATALAEAFRTEP